jgi:amino acid transporter
MSLADFLFGRALATSEEQQERLSIWTGVPTLGLDALASTGYGPEAALTVLLPLGAAAFRYFPLIIAGILVELAALYFSYRQTAEVYPSGGGAYAVAKDNFGADVGVWAAISLIVDYVLNVAVGIAAGVGAIVSAVPALQPHLLAVCLLVLVTLTLVNLRGVRESGVIFVGPVVVFVAALGLALAVGIIRTWLAGGQPHAVIAPPAMPAASRSPGVWLVLAAFANGCTAMTGIEAVSNGVPLFCEPKVRNAHRTLTAIMVILGSFLLALAYLCPAYHIVAMNERQPGYQTVLSQLVAAVAGHGVFFYICSVSIFIVLTYSAQTSFADFPRVCRLLANDRFLPPAFAERRRRLVYSRGIIILAVVSGLLLIAFGGVTDALIPLFAVGAFGGFLFSQAGMVRHWRRTGRHDVRARMFSNLFGAVTTAVVLAIILLTKFLEGAWITVAVMPALVLLLTRIRRHFEHLDRTLEVPLARSAGDDRRPIAVVPISGYSRLTEKALRVAAGLSDETFAIYVRKDQESTDALRRQWAEAQKDARLCGARLEIVDSPYRAVDDPVLTFVDRVERAHPDRMIAVVIPEVVEPHWYNYLLRSRQAAALRRRLAARADHRLVIVTSPWYVHPG